MGRSTRPSIPALIFLIPRMSTGARRSHHLIARLKSCSQRRDHRGHQGGPAFGQADGRGLQPRQPHLLDRRQPSRPGDQSLDLCSSTAHPPMPITGPRSSMHSTTWCVPVRSASTESAWSAVEEALKAMEYPNVQSVQIIFEPLSPASGGAFLRPGQAQAGGDSGARSPGQRSAHRQVESQYQFAADDHRNLSPGTAL